MTRIENAKFATRVVVAFAVSRVVKSIIINNATDENLYDHVLVTVGSIAIGGLVAEQAQGYADRFIDQIASALTTVGMKTT